MPLFELSSGSSVWLQDDLNWDLNVKQICMKIFSRISIIGKLKFAGIQNDDLLTIDKLFIRSVAEYCSVVFHTSLTQNQIRKFELTKEIALKIILDDKYSDYQTALEHCSLETLSERRQKRMLSFALTCSKEKFNSKLLPKNTKPIGGEHFKVILQGLQNTRKVQFPNVNTY